MQRMEQVSVSEVRAAAELLNGVARYTPMESSRPLAQAVGGPVFLKCENLQRTGSFKIRGAYVRIARLSAAEKALGVVAASAGNHAQGVELVGESLDDALEAATAFAARTGAVLVHPFDHPDVLRGQGTVGLEILEQVPDVATVVVAAGGGGLISGGAAVIRALKPGVRIVGVQAAQAAAWPG